MTEQHERPNLRDRFPTMRMVQGCAGGAIYAAEEDSKAYVIEDESALALARETGMATDLRGGLQRVLAFPSAVERDAYLRERGWLPRRRAIPRLRPSDR